MNQQPDKFFRDKLQGYQPAVSADAWKRISGNLGEKGNRRIWLKIAAGFLLLAAAGVLIVPLERDDTSSLISGKTGLTIEQSTKKEKINPAQRQPEEKEIENAPSPTIVEDETTDTKKTRKGRRASRPSSAAKNVVERNHAATTPKPQVELPEKAEEKNSVAKNNAAVVDQTTEEKNVTLVFTAQEVDEKYLRKKKALAEATPEVKETSTWRKLLDKANDLKHNQDPMGDLRQKKNEILALNFKNDNQSHENQ